MAADAETLCCAHARSVIEITREVTHLRGKDKGKTSRESIVYVSSLDFEPRRAGEMLQRIRRYWDIEGGLHQRLDVSAGEDRSRVRNPNSLLVLGILRRAALSVYYRWKQKQPSRRKSCLSDFYDAMSAFNHRKAFALINTPQRI